MIRITGRPYQVYEPYSDRWVYYVDGDVRTLYANGRPDAPTKDLAVPGDVIAGDPNWSGNAPFRYPANKNRFQCGRRIDLPEVQTIIAHLPRAYQQWFWKQF